MSLDRLKIVTYALTSISAVTLFAALILLKQPGFAAPAVPVSVWLLIAFSIFSIVVGFSYLRRTNRGRQKAPWPFI